MHIKSRHLYILILCVIAIGMLSSCDPASYPYLLVNRIVITNETPYLLVSERDSFGVGMRSQIPDHYFISQNYGETWQEISSPPIEMPPPIEQPEMVQLTVCVPNDLDICYRIAGKELVEISDDGGETWRKDWEMPLGRKKYMEKNPSVTPLLEVVPDTIPYDLGIISKGKEHIVIVAMGNQGVLVKSPNGVWERRAVSSTRESYQLTAPLPFYATSLKDATRSLGTETTWLLLATFIIFVALSFQGWRYIYTNVDKNTRKKIFWSNIPFIVATSGFLFFIFLFVVNLFAPYKFPVSYMGYLLHELLNNLSGYICLVPVFGLIFTWFFVVAFSPNRKIGLFAALTSMGYTLTFFAGTWLPFIFWAFGIIPIYEIALTVAIIIGILTAFWGFRNEKRIAILATR